MTAEDTKVRYRIGDVTEQLGISADTLRYYEKIGLLPPIFRSTSGMRAYDGQDLSRLRFIQRAKAMNFSLAEIRQLLEMRADPRHARDEVRELTRRKLAEIDAHIQSLGKLRNELELLTNLCQRAEAGCPIIEGLDCHGEQRLKIE